jgi:hypothetical protein
MYGYNRPKVTNISPANIFYEKLQQNKKFKNLKGFSDWTWSMRLDGSNFKRWFKYSNVRTFKSDWWLYQGKGKRRAIIQMPEYRDLSCRVFLKCLWVPLELANKGIATEVMQELLRMTDEVDQMAKTDERYDDKNITCGTFVISLIANSFVVRKGYWDVEQIAKGKDLIDWTSNPDADAKDRPDLTMMDELDQYLPKDEKRMSQKELEKFYIDKLGFVRCEELAFHEEYDWTNGRINRQLTISGRSVAHMRYPLLYPASNLKEWEREEDNEK